MPSQEEQDQLLIPLCLWLESLRRQGTGGRKGGESRDIRAHAFRFESKLIKKDVRLLFPTQYTAHQEKRRVLVGVVGAAGAGKSYLCALLAGLLNHPVLFPSTEGGGGGETRVAVLSMDAYHLRNEVLEAKGLKHLKGKKARRLLCRV